MRTDLELVTEIDAENPVLGDLRVDGGVVALVTDADAIAQEVRVRLRWWRAEFFLDKSLGVPYLEQILGKGISEQTIATILTAEIEDVEGISRVEEMVIDADRQTRLATISFVAITDGGETISETGVPVGGG